VSLGDGLALVAGLALLGVVTLDVHAAVLHHWGSDGPLSGRLSSVFFRLAVGLSRRLRPVTRRRVLGQVGPLMIPLTVALWAALTVVAFALIYLPWIAASFVPDTNVAAPARFADALHFSGVTFFTIGFGDIVPSGRAMRVISVVQGGAGFAFITLVISYFTALYGGYSHQRTAAASLQFQLGPGADASRFIVDHLADPGGTVLAAEVARLRDHLAGIRDRYLMYPTLHYFVAATPGLSLVRMVFVAQEIGLLLDTAVDRGRAPVVAGLGTRAGLRAAAVAVQRGMVEALLPPGPRRRALGGAAPRSEDPAHESWRARFRAACDTLDLHGVPVDRSGEENYCRERGGWEPELRAAAEALGESWDGLTAGG
jgi:hypothetical protein